MTKERLKDRKRNQEKSKSVQNYFHQKEVEVHVDSKEGKKQKSVTLPLRKRALPSSDEGNFLDDHVQSDSNTKRKKSKKDRGANTSEPSVSNDDKRQRKSEEKKKRTMEVEFTGTENASVCEESDCKEKLGFDSDSKKKELRDFNRKHSKRKNDKESKVEVSEERRKRKHDDERTLHEVQQGISLHANQKDDVQNICDSKNVDHEVKDKKKKKKKKNEIELENTLDTSNDKTSGLCTKVESEKSDTVKEKKKKKSKRQPGEASKAVVHPGVGYLRTWHFDRRNWNFKKVRQVWLLQNMFDQEQISDENFHILLKYLEGLKGTAKDKTIEMAEQRLESETGTSEQDTLVESRVHQVLQLLTD